MAITTETCLSSIVTRKTDRSENHGRKRQLLPIPILDCIRVGRETQVF